MKFKPSTLTFTLALFGWGLARFAGHDETTSASSSTTNVAVTPAAESTSPETKPDVTPLSIPGSEPFVFRTVGTNELRLHVVKPAGWSQSDRRVCMVSFFGGGTDLPSYFNHSRGMVVATTIAQYSYVAVNFLERLLEKRFRISYSVLEVCDKIEDIKHNIIRTILADYPNLLGDRFIDIHSYADLPSGTGVGSSSAFAVGMLNALHGLNANYVQRGRARRIRRGRRHAHARGCRE